MITKQNMGASGICDLNDACNDFQSDFSACTLIMNMFHFLVVSEKKTVSQWFNK